MRIDDGQGSGVQAGVTEKFRLKTEASTRSSQSRASIEDGTAFQVITEDVSVSATEEPILVIKNNDRINKVIVTYLRVETIGVDAANSGGYWKMSLGGDYSSGGSSLTPVNVNTDSGIEALNIACYDGTTPIVTSGALNKIDKNWQANELVVYNKEGSLVISPGGMLTISYKGSTATGTAIARVSFYTSDNGGT